MKMLRMRGMRLAQMCLSQGADCNVGKQGGLASLSMQCSAERASRRPAEGRSLLELSGGRAAGAGGRGRRQRPLRHQGRGQHFQLHPRQCQSHELVRSVPSPSSLYLEAPNLRSTRKHAELTELRALH